MVSRAYTRGKDTTDLAGRDICTVLLIPLLILYGITDQQDSKQTERRLRHDLKDGQKFTIRKRNDDLTVPGVQEPLPFAFE